MNSRFYNQQITDILHDGGVGVGPTDTIYGLLAQADNQEAVERVYKLKTRNPSKPCIVLVERPEQLADYGVDKEYIEKAKPYWPAPVTLVLPTKSAPDYLTRGHDSLAFRMPDSIALRKLISVAGTLIAPSANPEGMLPSLSVNQAKAYFGDEVDFYVGSNQPIDASASTILKLTGDSVEQLR